MTQTFRSENVQGMGNGKIWCIILPSNLVTHDEDLDTGLIGKHALEEVSALYHSRTFLTCHGLISAVCYVLVLVQPQCPPWQCRGGHLVSLCYAVDGSVETKTSKIRVESKSAQYSALTYSRAYLWPRRVGRRAGRGASGVCPRGRGSHGEHQHMSKT
jgi:hypothetical protein